MDTLKRVASFEVMYSIHSHKRKEKARLSGGEDSHLEAINLKQSSEESVTRKREKKKKRSAAVTAGRGFVYFSDSVKCSVGGFPKAY